MAESTGDRKTLLEMMDRQIHTYGMEAMDKLQKGSVFISGMSGTGVEIGLFCEFCEFTISP